MKRGAGAGARAAGRPKLAAMRPPIPPAPLVALACAAALAAPAAAQTGFTVQPPPYQSAPWWMREPVVASLGEVRTELPANRASFSGAFESVERTAAEATAASAAKVRALGEALTALGADKVRVEVGFSTRPLYAQYKDKDGTVQENQRADKIDRYAVTASVSVEVRDVRLVERAYALMVAAKPTSTQRVFFRLQPDNATQTELFRLAVADAKRRATEGAAEAGARLGAVKLIDPTGRACQQDVLITGAPRSYGGSGDLQEVVVTASARAEARMLSAPAPPPPPPPPPGSAEEVEAAASNLHLPLQPPLQQLTREACVVYALGG